MIISASYRTDIPAYYGAWFLTRLRAGWVEVANPYGRPPARVSLAPQVARGFVFWTRNPKPFLPALEAVAALGMPFMLHVSMTAAPPMLDPGTPPPDHTLAVMAEIRRRWGPKALVWRYDPIVFSDLSTPDDHRTRFAALARRVAAEGLADEVVASVMQPYKKAVRRLDPRFAARGLSWWDPPAEDKRALLADLAAIAAEEGLLFRLCAQPELLAPGMAEAACVDAQRLSDIAGRLIPAKKKPHRGTCGCAESRDIGAYDTCPAGCAYCYAVSSEAKARAAVAAQDPAAPRLGR